MLAGVTRMLVTKGGVTVSTVELPAVLLAPTKVAEMVVVPGARVLARPELSIVAFDVSLEVQADAEVTSCVLLSEYVAVAVNCWVRAAGTEGLAGVMTSEVTDRLGITVILVEPRNGPVLVLMVTVPSAMEVTRPVALTVAMVGSLDFHAEALVRLLPPTPEWERKRPVEVSCRVWPETTMPLAGEIWMRN